jgi:alpha-beta hydrolase superfamily lysophospholipase
MLRGADPVAVAEPDITVDGEARSRTEHGHSAPRRSRIRVRRVITILLVFLMLAYALVSVGLVVETTMSSHHSVAVPAELSRFAREDVSFPSRDDHIALKGWLVHSPAANGRIVIFAHGWKADRDGFAGLARAMLGRGYDSLLFDMRASGESGGDRSTLGNLERRDVLGAWDVVRSRGYAAGDVVVLGASAGAAAVLEASPDLPGAGAIISDSAFADLNPILDDRWELATGLPAGGDVLGLALGRLAGVDPGLRPAEAVRAQPQRAFLFLHATDDALIPSANAARLYAASANPASRVDVIPAPGHVLEFAADPSRYLADVLGFIDAQMGSVCQTRSVRC